MVERYFELMYDWNGDTDNTVCCDNDDLDTSISFPIMRGEVFESLDSSIFFYANPDGDFEDYLNNTLTLPLISEKFKGVLESLGVTGVQYFPIAIKNSKTKEHLVTYWLVNILNLPDALDLNLSRYREFYEDVNKVMGLTHPVLIGEKIKDQDILRVQKARVGIFVSKKLKDKITRAKLTGMSFREVRVV